MKNSFFFKLITLFVFCFSAEIAAQNIWTVNRDDTFKLNNSALSSKLKQINTNRSVTIQFPDNNGALTTFEIVDNSLLPPGLAEKYPNVHSYKGKNTEFKDLSITFTCTPKGISGTLIKGAKVYSLKQIKETNNYKIIDDNNSLAPRVICSTKSEPSSDLQFRTNNSARTLVGDNTLRVLRTAIIVTGEYSNYFTNGVGSEAEQKAIVLGAITTSLNNINPVFERDLGIRFELIENNDELIFLNENTDPFLTNDLNDLININNQLITNTIGSNNFDIGHVLSIGGGGVAYVGALCGSLKAGAASAGNPPEGTSFDFTLFAHELGHQLGATHTQNSDCDRVPTTSFEPGTGSTIMGYAGAGVCNLIEEVQPLSDEYFHRVSIDQIRNHVQSVSCGIENSIVNNNNPIIEQLPNYTIPADTPFSLEAIASDPDGDSLTYCWEQLDNEIADVIPPVSNAIVGPLFRSLLPTTNPERVFETNTTWEVIPSVTRTLNFGVTVRDGNAGGIASSDLSINVVDTGEKFEITDPLGSSFPQNFITEIKWNVAGTDSNDINTENVSIELSYDSGETYPVLLSESTPNDGSERVLIPLGTSSNTARIRITPIGNIYYTVAESDFTIREEIFDDLAPIPNPVKDDILIQVFKLQVPEYEFTLYDLKGQLLMTETLKSNPLITEILPVNISNLERGMYIMKLVVGTQIHTRKIIKD